VRGIDITVPPERTDAFVSDVRTLSGLVTLRVQRGASLQPPGDAISIAIVNRSLPELMHILDTHGIGQGPDSSATTSDMLGVVSRQHAETAANDISDITWEEMDALLSKESNMTVNGLAVMSISGILATVGIATNALHLVIGAMIIAPGFGPLVRIGIGGVTKGSAWRPGVSHAARGYLALVAGAVAAALVLRALGESPTGGESTYLPAGVLATYWTTITVPSLIVSAVASIAGAILVAANRSVLTAGVMVALALVPTAAIAGAALTTGEFDLAGRGLLRWAIEVGFVVTAGFLVMAWKQSHLHRRGMRS
jgi:hypothetical protein